MTAYHREYELTPLYEGQRKGKNVIYKIPTWEKWSAAKSKEVQLSQRTKKDEWIEPQNWSRPSKDKLTDREWVGGVRKDWSATHQPYTRTHTDKLWHYNAMKCKDWNWNSVPVLFLQLLKTTPEKCTWYGFKVNPKSILCAVTVNICQ